MTSISPLRVLSTEAGKGSATGLQSQFDYHVSAARLTGLGYGRFISVGLPVLSAVPRQTSKKFDRIPSMRHASDLVSKASLSRSFPTLTISGSPSSCSTQML